MAKDKYPLVTRYLDDLDMLGFPPPAETRALQDKAFKLIDRDGGGTHEEKQASMVAAAMILYPASVYIEIGRYFEEPYTPEVEQVVQSLMGTPRDSFMPLMLAQANAAAGIAVLEDVTQRLQDGKPLSVPAPLPEVLEGMKAAYGQDMSLFSYLEAPALLARYETARDAAFEAVEAKIQAGQVKRPHKPRGGSFDL